MSGKNSFSQPAVAGGFVPKGQTVSTYSPTVFGCKCIVNGGVGIFLVTLDEPIEDGRYVVVATAVNPGEITTAQLDSAPIADQFEILTLDDTDTQIDSGVMFAVFAIPKTH
jgi:hypothetical protein